jgi:hypothetical protein
MTEKQILEYNKRCMDFLGVEIDNPTFDTNWESIMQVVAAIQKVKSYDSGAVFGTEVTISNDTCTIRSGKYGLGGRRYNSHEYFDNTYSGQSRKEATIHAINNYIFWYDTIKK